MRSFIHTCCRLLGAWTLLLVLGAALPAHAQSASMDEAEEAYQFADFDEAIDLFSQIAQSPESSAKEKQEALLYMGRAYVAQDRKQKAREALRRLLEMNPQKELDPDMEPPPLMRLYYKVRKDLQGGYGVEKGAPGLQTLAIMDFTNSSVDENERFQPLQKGLPSMMINYMQGATELKVIERERIEWLLNELELQRQGDVVDQSTAVRTGKLLGANAVVFGSFSVHQDRMWISARVVKVETGEILLAEQLFGEKDQFFEHIEDLSQQVAESIDLTLENLGSRTDTESLDATMAYSEGLALLEENKYQAAYDKFMQAQEHDPDFERAKLKAQSLQPMLAQANTGGSSSEQSLNR